MHDLALGLTENVPYPALVCCNLSPLPLLSLHVKSHSLIVHMSEVMGLIPLY